MPLDYGTIVQALSIIVKGCFTDRRDNDNIKGLSAMLNTVQQGHPLAIAEAAVLLAETEFTQTM